MSDLSTTYLGLRLRAPVVASSGPLTGDPATAVLLDEAGVGAVVLPSLFEEEVLHEELELQRVLDAGTHQVAESIDWFPAIRDVPTATERYADLVRRTKEAVSVPVIASLNASSTGAWVGHAQTLADAGADAVELNLYRVAADPTRPGWAVEDDDVALVTEVRAVLDVPLAVKLSPYYTATASMALRLADVVDGLVLFNRFYQPDLDIEALTVEPRLALSEPWELRLPLRWIAILRPWLAGRASLAATSGVHDGAAVAKALLVGADVAMTTSALLQRGPGHVRTMLDELTEWMDRHEYESVSQLRGSVSYATSDDPGAFERANYVRALHTWSAR